MNEIFEWHKLKHEFFPDIGIKTKVILNQNNPNSWVVDSLTVRQIKEEKMVVYLK